MTIFRTKPTLEKVIEYIEKDLKILLSHESEESKYYKIGEVFIRVSNHFQEKSKKCVGVAVVDGAAFIHVFNKVITTKSMKEVKQFLWNLTSFYGNDQFNIIHEATFKIFREQAKEYLEKIENQTTQLSGLNKKIIHLNNELNILKNKNSDWQTKNNELKNQIVNLTKQIAYLNRVEVQPKKKSTLANLKTQLNKTKNHCGEAIELIYEISEHLEKLPENLQAKILDYINDYYDKK